MACAVGLAAEPNRPHWPLYCTNRGRTVCVTFPSAAVSGTTASIPATINLGTVSASLPRKSELWPCTTAEPNQRRFLTLGTGPPSDPSKRLKPTLMLLPNGSAVSLENDPATFSPPALVVYAITPDCASENSTPSAPVVTDASSRPLVPTGMRCEPLLVPRTGAPSM